MVVLPQVFSSDELRVVGEYLEAAEFEDGKLTAHGYARDAKENEQLRREDGAGSEFDLLCLGALKRHPIFQSWAQPRKISLPLVNRYTSGSHYGPHLDAAVTTEGLAMRRDISVTVFLSDPSDYRGGELIVESPAGPQSVKLAAGEGFAYQTHALHEVRKVTEGKRLAIVFWAQSLIPDDQLRQMHFDLIAVLTSLEERGLDGREALLLQKVQQNFLRRFAQI